jgi:hypothetical protein
MPGILLALFASIQTATWFIARSVALTAAQEATTAQRAYNAPDRAGQERANEFLRRTGDWLANPTVVVTRTGDRVTATVTGQALSLIPGVRLTVRQTASGSVDRFIATSNTCPSRTRVRTWDGPP